MNKLLLPIHLVILLCSLAGCVAGEIPESPGSTTTPSVVLSSPDPIREPSPSVEDTVVVTTETVATSDAVEQPTLCVPTILSVALDDLSPLYLRWKPQSSTLYLQVNTPKDEVWELDTLSSKLTPSRDFSVLVDPKIAERLIGLVPANAIQPTLAPTGDKLVYVTRIFTKPTPTADPEGITIKDREFLFDIHIITADNPAIPTVFRAEGSPRKLIWSKDGEYLLVQMFAEFPTPSPLIILDTKSKDLEPVVSNEYADFVSVSPNAVNILYNTNGGTIALNTQTDQKTQLSIQLTSISQIFWYPDNKRFLFLKPVIGQDEGNRNDQEVYIYNVETQEEERLGNIQLKPNISMYEFSEDSSKVVFIDDSSKELKVVHFCDPGT